MNSWLMTAVMTAAVKGGAILILALVAARLLRRQSAAVRHSVWLAAILSQLLIPALGMAFPQWRLEMPASISRGITRAAIAVAPADLPANVAFSGRGNEAAIVDSRAATPRAGTVAQTNVAPAPVLDPELENVGASPLASTGVAPARSAIAWPTLALYLWMAGAGLVMLWLVAGTVGVALVARRATRVTDGAWLTLITQVSAELGLGRGVVLLRGRGLSVPVTWGVLVPVVLLPEEADEWPTERRRTVLLHELAHVHRLDALSQLVAHLVLALCWFDPLVWIGVRALRSESEKACDDCVLRHGTEPSAYVTDLLSIVRAARPTRVPALAALAMARSTEFEGRVLSILDARARRRAVGRAAQLATAVAALALVAPLAAMQPARPRATPTPPSAPTTRLPNVAMVADLPVADPASPADPATPEPPPAPDVPQPPMHVAPAPTPTPTPTPTPSPDAWYGSRGRVRAPNVNVRVQTPRWDGRSQPAGSSAAVMPLVSALTDSDIGVRQSAVRALGELEDPRAVEALMNALARDADAKVRETAAWALGQIEDHKAVPALLDALQRDQVPAVRKQSAWALGQIEDASSVPGLGAALRDATPEVRRMALWALGQIEDPRAVPFLIPALTNSDAEVRKQAAWALGQIESKDAVPALTAALRDSEARVRETAAWALGQIQDARSIAALGAALKDPTPSVRKNAAWALGQVESREAVGALVASLDDSDREVRKTVVWALGQIEDPAAVNGLAALTRSSDPEMRRASVVALSRIGGAGAVDALVALLKDPDPDVRRAAVSALGRH
jgi:HEAT repeat protein/beta-lactamase regulating signal transducer with metallopeptidase domain